MISPTRLSYRGSSQQPLQNYESPTSELAKADTCTYKMLKEPFRKVCVRSLGYVLWPFGALYRWDEFVEVAEANQ